MHPKRPFLLDNGKFGRRSNSRRATEPCKYLGLFGVYSHPPNGASQRLSLRQLLPMGDKESTMMRGRRTGAAQSVTDQVSVAVYPNVPSKSTHQWPIRKLFTTMNRMEHHPKSVCACRCVLGFLNCGDGRCDGGGGPRFPVKGIHQNDRTLLDMTGGHDSWERVLCVRIGDLARPACFGVVCGRWEPETFFWRQSRETCWAFWDASLRSVIRAMPHF
jgi:hypothetical protein